ncbi:site-specific integrase [Metapseudomonas otitidis]|uniref:site-specific integrase n=1 Tax=Metapseudomonas otitidis TaxID=319939 RepID=UPI001F0E1ECF|nr:site-specific integrase [Pseudomonas otitidis]
MWGIASVPSMTPSPSYLTRNRHGTFYFRIVIPRPLRPLLNGQREVRRTLKTDSERLARKRARQYVARYEAVFDKVVNMVERDELGLTEADYKELMELLPDTKPMPDFSSPQDKIQSAEPILSEKEIEARQRRREIERLLTGAYGRPIPTELEKTAQQLLELSRTYQPTELRAILPKLRDELALGRLTGTSAASASTAAPRVDPAMASWTLYQVWQHRLELDKADTAEKSGQANYGGSLELNERFARVMTVLTNHKPVCDLSKQDWQAAYDAARKMKVGAEASIDPPTPRDDLLTDDPEQMVGHERTNAFIDAMKRMQHHARTLDLTAVREEELRIKHVKKRESARTRDGKPFSASDIEAIFSGYIYRGIPPSNRTKAYPFWFWLPLIAYFTGARTNEIAQLDTADIREVDGHPCFDFCPDDPKAFEAKRIKTGEARQVPIHPRLIELGLLEYVASQRQARQKKLFGDGLRYLPPRDNETEHNKEGWAKAASKFFNESPNGYLVEIGVHKANDGKSLYSFRHTLETNLRHARRNGMMIDQTIIDAITGHVPESIAGKHYDGGATTEQMLTALKLLPMPIAIGKLTSYQVDFVERFDGILRKSIESHRQRHPRTV